MKFLIFALCIGVALAELPIEEVVVATHEEQVHHEEEATALCSEQGVFANPHDPEHRTFIRCELEPIELQCDEGFIFNEESLMCVEKPQPPAPVNLDLVNWREVLTCDPEVVDKYFRNPYDCSKFYRCYTQGEFKRMDPMTCLPSMIFDEVLETCLPAEQFNSLYGVECVNRALPVVNKPEEVVPEVVPEVPEETHEIPEEAHEVPEETHEIPEETHEVPEETHEVPEETHEIPEETHEIPEETHEIPEETHEIPEETHEIPEEHHEIPEETHEIPEETHEVPEHVPETEAEKPNLNEILKQIKDLFGRGL